MQLLKIKLFIIYYIIKDKIAIFVTHRQNLIKYFDSIIIIHNGEIYQFNSLEDFKLTKPDIYRLTIPN